MEGTTSAPCPIQMQLGPMWTTQSRALCKAWQLLHQLEVEASVTTLLRDGAKLLRI